MVDEKKKKKRKKEEIGEGEMVDEKKKKSKIITESEEERGEGEMTESTDCENVEKMESVAAERKRKGKGKMMDERKKRKITIEEEERGEGEMSESTDSESESEEESGGGEMSESTVERSDAEKSTPGEKKKKKKKKGGKGKIRRRKKIEKERKKMKKEKAKQSIDTMVVIPLETSGLYPASWLLQKKPMLSDLMMTYYWGPSWSVPDHQWFIHAGFPEDSSRENNPSFQRTFNTKDFSNQVLEDMKIFWPERAQKFWLDRWQKHCRGTGMTPEEYFSTVLDIHRAIQSITGDDGIDLESGVSMKANEAVSILEKKLGRVRISTVKCKEDDYIAELKILIEKKSYSIGWRLKMSSYLGSIEDKGGESMVILPNEPLEPREKKKKDLKEKTGNKVL